MSTNLAILDGRLGQKPELINFQTGTSKCTFFIATNDTYINNDGKEVESTEWHEIVVWGKRAVACSEHLDKGSRVIVRGSIRTDKYQNKEGKDVYRKFINAERVDFVLIPAKSHQQNDGALNDEQANTERRFPFKDYIVTEENSQEGNVPF